MTGLTNEEVQERIAQGQVNNNENPNTRTYKQIIMENTLTFFNFLNLVLLVLVLLVGSYKNSMFVGIIFINTVIGIIQEVRAKKTIDNPRRLFCVKEKNGKFLQRSWLSMT